jgi:hypothetical protein
LHHNNFYKSLGLADVVENKRKINKVLRLASFSPDFLYEREKDKKGRVFFNRYKYLGSGFGVSVSGYRRIRINKEGKRVEKHVVMDWGIFALAHEDSIVSNTYIDMDENHLTYCFTEEAATANAFEFRINNCLELLDCYKKLKNHEEVIAFENSICKINMAMLMVYGTVLLPVDKSTEEYNEHMKEEQHQRELIARARLGDTEAEQSLHKIAKDQEIELSERLANEDLLSVFEGYFLNLVEQSGIFSILADILDVEELTNEASDEKLYRLTICITGTKTTVYINQQDLMGLPGIGMRLMGIGMLQGSVKI